MAEYQFKLPTALIPEGVGRLLGLAFEKKFMVINISKVRMDYKLMDCRELVCIRLLTDYPHFVRTNDYTKGDKHKNLAIIGEISLFNTTLKIQNIVFKES